MSPLLTPDYWLAVLVGTVVGTVVGIALARLVEWLLWRDE